MSLQPAELQNAELHAIRDILVPTKAGTEALLVPPASDSSKSSVGLSTNANTEFIPHIFYTLYQIQKDPNNSNNQLENKTGVIKHRLRSCKSLIRESNSVVELLGKTPEEWEQFIANRDRELQLKKNVLLNLQSKIADVLANSNYTPVEEPEVKDEESKTSDKGETDDVAVKNESNSENNENEDNLTEDASVPPRNNDVEVPETKTSSESPENSVPAPEGNNAEVAHPGTLPADIDQGLDDIYMEL